MSQFRLLPLAGIALTLVLYFAAAALYPGGTKLDPRARGYDHFHNYWCDLQDKTAYNGKPNPGQPLAFAATILLPVSLIPFWLGLPSLFRPVRKRLRRFVQVTGSMAMVLASLMPIAHDLIINVAGPLVFIVFMVSQIGLLESREFRIVILAALSMLLCGANFLMWQTGFRLDLMPIVQKTAFLFSFAYICAGTQRIVGLGSFPGSLSPERSALGRI